MPDMAQSKNSTRRCYKCGESKEIEAFSRGCGRCKPCDHKHSIEWKRANPERYRARHNRWAKENRDSGKEYARRLKNEYGISIDDFNRMRSEQGGLCAICQKASRRLEADADGDANIAYRIRALKSK